MREAALALGDDVVVEGRGTCVPFVRRRRFAPWRRPSGSTSPAASPIIRRVADVDDEVRSLLQTAYEQIG